MTEALDQRLAQIPDGVLARAAPKGTLLAWCDRNALRPTLLQIEQERARRTSNHTDPLNQTTERNHR